MGSVAFASTTRPREQTLKESHLSKGSSKRYTGSIASGNWKTVLGDQLGEARVKFGIDGGDS